MLLCWLKKIEIRKYEVFGFFPVVRLISIIENPLYIIHLIKKNLWYKRFGKDFSYKYKKFKFLSAQETLELLIKEKQNVPESKLNKLKDILEQTILFAKRVLKSEKIQKTLID